MKPKLVVDSSSMSHKQWLNEISVRLRPGVIKSEEARAFFVEVYNKGRRTAEDVRPLVWLSGNDGMLPLVMISPSPTPQDRGSIRWLETEETFEEYKEPFFTALVHHSEGNEESVTLYPKGLGRAFILFFTLRNGNAAYIPSNAQVSIPAPEKFRISLAFEMKDHPLYESKEFDVFMRSWDSFEVVEVQQSRFQFLRKSPK